MSIIEHPDFNVEWQGTKELTARKILANMIVEKLRAGMPIVIVAVGKSGSGKSALSVFIQDIVYEELGLNFADYVDKCVLISPDDWSTKTRKIFFDKNPEWKNIVSIQMDEAKFLINSDAWQTQQNKAINGIIATSRTVKPVVFIIVAQLLKDIQSKTRESLDIIFEIRRSPKQRPVVVPKVLYEKRYDINKINIKPRCVRGIIRFPDGNNMWIHKLVIRPPMPRKEVWDKYKSFEQPDKMKEINKLFDSLEDAKDKLNGVSNKKIKEFAEWLKSNPHEIEKYGKWSKRSGQWSFDKSSMDKFGYTRRELKEIESIVQSSYAEKNFEGDTNATTSV